MDARYPIVRVKLDVQFESVPPNLPYEEERDTHTMHATGEWTMSDSTDRTISLLRTDQFRGCNFLVERKNVHEHEPMCACTSRVETQLGVFTGYALSIMLKHSERWNVNRYAIIDTREG